MSDANLVELATKEDFEEHTVSRYVPDPKKESPERIRTKQSLAKFPEHVRRFALDELVTLDRSILNKALASPATEVPILLRRFKDQERLASKRTKFKETYKGMKAELIFEGLKYVVILRKLYM
jgi:hypothetical protein